MFDLFDFINSTTFLFLWNMVISIASIFVFTKMGLSGWAAIIPIYGQWCLFDRIWGQGGVFVALYIFTSMFFPLAANAIILATYYMVFKGFGKNTLLSILYTIFTPIGILICAVDGSRFHG